MSEWGNKDLANNVPKYLNYNHPGNNTVYLINPSRIANSGPIGESVVHQGWVKVYPGEGPLSTIKINTFNAANTYANAKLEITGAGVNAAANLVVTGTGSNDLSVVITNSGSGYTSNTQITANSASNANNKTLTFSFSGGRIGRDLTETLVALSAVPEIKANNAVPFFKD